MKVGPVVFHRLNFPPFSGPVYNGPIPSPLPTVPYTSGGGDARAQFKFPEQQLAIKPTFFVSVV